MHLKETSTWPEHLHFLLSSFFSVQADGVCLALHYQACGGSDRAEMGFSGAVTGASRPPILDVL